MVFRVLILSDRDFRDYPRLRDTLDSALVNRLPEVEILTRCQTPAAIANPHPR